MSKCIQENDGLFLLMMIACSFFPLFPRGAKRKLGKGRKNKGNGKNGNTTKNRLFSKAEGGSFNEWMFGIRRGRGRKTTFRDVKYASLILIFFFPNLKSQLDWRKQGGTSLEQQN